MKAVHAAVPFFLLSCRAASSLEILVEHHLQQHDRIEGVLGDALIQHVQDASVESIDLPLDDSRLIISGKLLVNLLPTRIRLGYRQLAITSFFVPKSLTLMTTVNGRWNRPYSLTFYGDSAAGEAGAAAGLGALAGALRYASRWFISAGGIDFSKPSGIREMPVLRIHSRSSRRML